VSINKVLNAIMIEAGFVRVESADLRRWKRRGRFEPQAAVGN
jgi:hypothetical protein